MFRWMKCRLSALLVIYLFSLPFAYGQWDAQFSQYWMVKTYYNPSFAGETNNIESLIFHRSQWVGLNNAPKTSMAFVQMPLDFLGKRHGVGVYLYNDKAGLFSNTMTSIQYAYKFRFKKGRTLNIGLQGLYGNIDFDASKIHLPGTKLPQENNGEPYIPDLPSGGGSKAFDMGLGVSWITPAYWAGFSITHLWEPKFDVGDNYSAYMGRTYYLVGGYNIKLSNPLFVIKPSVLIKSDISSTQFDLTGRIEYARFLSGGIGWRKDDGCIFMLGAKIRNFEAGYAYDLTTSALSKVSNGSHEVFIKYSIPIERKKLRGAQKSIRLL